MVVKILDVSHIYESWGEAPLFLNSTFFARRIAERIQEDRIDRYGKTKWVQITHVAFTSDANDTVIYMDELGIAGKLGELYDKAKSIEDFAKLIEKELDSNAIIVIDDWQIDVVVWK